MRSAPQLLGIDYWADQRGIKGLPGIRKNPALGHVASVASMTGRSAFWATWFTLVWAGQVDTVKDSEGLRSLGSWCLFLFSQHLITF